MKEKYLNELRELLDKYNINIDELNDIIADYDGIIQDAINKGLSEKKILKLIGNPEEVVENLSEEFQKGEEYIYIHHGGKTKTKSYKITLLMPFIAVGVFFILGFVFNLWHPGWLVFLSVPMIAIIISPFEKHSMNGLISFSPIIALIIFLVLGFWLDMWHPGWLIFLVVPIIAITSSIKTMRFISYITAITPFVATIAFVLVGEYSGVWNPMWLVFLLIPMIGVLHENRAWKIIVFEIGFLIAIGIYLLFGYKYGEWGYGLFAFIIPIGISLILSEDSFLVINPKNRFECILFLIMLFIYIGGGVFFSETWSYLWMIFLLIPVSAIIRHGNRDSRVIALSPFIAIAIFFSLGFFFGWWAYSWIAFFLIPIVSIIKNL